MLRRSAISLLVLSLALPAAARTRPHYGGAIRIETAGDALAPGSIARRLVYDGLFSFDAEGHAAPALAIDMQPDNDAHRWQIRLRQGVHFHDGSLFTAVNAVASLNASCGAACPWSALHAVGASLVFTADSPMPNLPDLLAGDAYRIQAPAAAGAPPAGTGPFRIANLAKGQLTLEACDTCWQGRPFADTIEVRAGRAARDQLQDLALGHADLVEIPVEDLRAAREQHLSLLTAPAAELVALDVSEIGALANPNVRASIALAVDRAALANVIFQKLGEPTADALPPAMTGYGCLFPAERDLAHALALRGGLSVGVLELSVDAAGPMQLAAQRLALNLHDAGFNVTPVNAATIPRGELVLRRIRLEGASPAALLESIERASGTQTAVEARNAEELYRAERDFLSRNRLVPLVDLPRAWAVGSRLRDLALVGGMPDLAHASLEDAP